MVTRVVGFVVKHATNKINVGKVVLLGPLDHATQNFLPLSVVFVYRGLGFEKEEVIPIGKLQRALERLLDYYPHLTGRVVMNEEDKTPRIEHLGSGVKLVQAKCNEPLEIFEKVVEDDGPGSVPRLVITNLPGGGNALLPPIELSDSRAPILTIQHTKFACGGVSIGICIPHIMCDAAGFFQLVRDLTELYRGFELCGDQINEVRLSRPPCIGSYMAELHGMTPQERREALASQPKIVRLSPEVNETAAMSTDAADKPTPPPITGRILRFSSSELKALKAEANADSSEQLSTFCVLTAHIWQSVFRARVSLLVDEGKTALEAADQVSRQLLVSTDLRSRNQLEGLPPRYFANAILCPALVALAVQLLDGTLSTLASSIRDAVKPQDPAEMQKTMRWIAAQPNKQRVQPCCNYAERGVIVTQWSKFDMYKSAQFEVPPALVAQPFTPVSLFDGVVYFLAAEDQLSQSGSSLGATVGSLDVSLALSEPIWTILDKDVRFRRHRGW